MGISAGQTARLRGFTLIELLIVVAIIAILAAIAVPNFLEAQTRAKVSRSKSDMRAMATAAETYSLDYNKYMTDSNMAPSYQRPEFTYDSWGTTNVDDYKSIQQKYGLKYDALFRLTSPVAYMTSLPSKNPFGRYAAYNAGDFWEGYTYRGTSVMKRIAVSVYPKEWVGKNCGYAFDCTGPSNKLRDAQGKILVYDPTNGTLSNGGIWYVKGPTAYHSFH